MAGWLAEEHLLRRSGNAMDLDGGAPARTAQPVLELRRPSEVMRHGALMQQRQVQRCLRPRLVYPRMVRVVRARDRHRRDPNRELQPQAITQAHP